MSPVYQINIIDDSKKEINLQDETILGSETIQQPLKLEVISPVNQICLNNSNNELIKRKTLSNISSIIKDIKPLKESRKNIQTIQTFVMGDDAVDKEKLRAQLRTKFEEPLKDVSKTNCHSYMNNALMFSQQQKNSKFTVRQTMENDKGNKNLILTDKKLEICPESNISNNQKELGIPKRFVEYDMDREQVIQLTPEKESRNQSGRK